MSKKKKNDTSELEDLIDGIEKGEDLTDTCNADDQQTETEETSDSKVASIAEEVELQKNKYLRLMAEFDNFKKRTAVEYSKMVSSANRSLMSDLIEIRETFNRALEGNATQDAEAFQQGIQLTYGKFVDILTRHGLESFGEVGDAFDPALHDAMMKQASTEIPAEHIAQIFEQGYKLQNTIIRHARVIVSSGTDN